MNFEKARKLIVSSLAKRIPPSKETIHYYSSYWALLKFAAETQDDPQNNGILGLSCAVYGWMPTILKNWKFENFNADVPVSTIRNLDTVGAARAFLSRIDPESPINNSWVGLSKLLHFLNPEIFPIWDSRIAKHFDLKWDAQLNNKGAYVAYFDFIHESLAVYPLDAKAMTRELVQQNCQVPSRVRCLELLLFEEGR